MNLPTEISLPVGAEVENTAGEVVGKIKNATTLRPTMREGERYLFEVPGSPGQMRYVKCETVHPPAPPTPMQAEFAAGMAMGRPDLARGMGHQAPQLPADLTGFEREMCEGLMLGGRPELVEKLLASRAGRR